MSQIRLYLDEDAMSRRLASALQLRGINTATVLDAGMVQATDEDLLRFAARQSRVLYSFNLSDFCRIHREWIAANRTHAGIVLAPQQRYSVGDQLRRLLHLIGSKLAEEMKDRVEFLSNWG